MADESRKLPVSIGDVLGALSNYAKSYCEENDPVDSVIRNKHMNDLRGKYQRRLTKDMVDAVVVDFINYIGGVNCVDYAMYTKDLTDGKKFT